VLSPGQWRLLGLAVLVFAVTGAVVVTVGGDIGGQQMLVIEDYEEGTELLSVSVEENTTVVLAYTHSVEKTPVRDIYEVRDGELYVSHMTFRSFGAGLPSTADVERDERGRFVHDPPDRPTGDVVVAPSAIAGHELVVDGERYDLVGLADGGSVRIRVTT
jgi:hypothetical protein